MTRRVIHEVTPSGGATNDDAGPPWSTADGSPSGLWPPIIGLDLRPGSEHERRLRSSHPTKGRG